MFEIKSDESIIPSKSLVFFTRAVAYTLGDPSAASKLIHHIKQQYGNSCEITMILILDKEEYRSAASSLFEGLEIRFLPVIKKDFPSFIISTECSTILNTTDGIIFFPSFPQFSEHESEEILTRYPKKTFVALEYDAYKKMIFSDFASRCIVMKTGLAEENLGIFCTEEISTSNNRSALLEITDSSDLSCSALLREREAQIFFGYFNKGVSECSNPQANPMVYIDCCLALSSLEKPIDFVLPLDSLLKPEKNIDNIFSHFKNHPKLKDCQLQFWKKDADNKMVCLKTEGNDKKIIRFINGFPFTPKT